MSIFSNLNSNYGQDIHRRMFYSVEEQSNNLLVGTGRKILRMSAGGTLARYYVKKLDGITWKEDLNLLATSVVWSIVPLIINIVALPFEIAATLLSGVLLCLSSILLAPFYRHIPYNSSNNGYLKTAGTNFTMSLAVMTIGTLFTLLSSVIDIIRAIPFVGHALRMGYKLIDGQYKNPCASTGNSNRLHTSTGGSDDSDDDDFSAGGAAPVVSQSESQPSPSRILTHTPFERIFANLLGFAASYMRDLFFGRQEAEINTHQQIDDYQGRLMNLYNKNSDLMAELSLGNGRLEDNDLIRFCDLMSALHQNKEYKSGESNTLYFNTQSTGRVNALDFIMQITNDSHFFVTILDDEFIEAVKIGVSDYSSSQGLTNLMIGLKQARDEKNNSQQQYLKATGANQHSLWRVYERPSSTYNSNRASKTTRSERGREVVSMAM